MKLRHKWWTSRLCMAGVSQLLDVCDLCVTDGAALPLSSEHWMKSRHSGKKSDNLGMDAPCFLNNRLHPTWSRVWSPAWHDTFSIMLPNCDMAAITQHVLLASASTPLKSQVPLHRRVANLEERIKESQSRSCCKTRSHARLSVGQWLDGKKKRNLCLLWRWFQMKSVPVKAPFEKWVYTVSLPNDLGVRVQLTHFVFTFQRAGVRESSKFATIKQNCLLEKRRLANSFRACLCDETLWLPVSLTPL